MIITRPVDPVPDEPCDTSSRFPVGYLPVQGDAANAWRSLYLAEFKPLVGQPIVLLHLSSQAFLAATAPGADAGSLTARGTALADLAVSGAQTFAAFRAAGPTDAPLQASLTADPGPSAPPVTAANVAASVKQALDRAYSVAYALRGYGWRSPLGWIECCGEADSPHRPVNVASIPYQQFDLNVTTNAPPGASTTLRTRYAIIPGQQVDDDPRVPAWVERRVPPADFMPLIFDDRGIILYVHGHMSRLEECGDLAPKLISPSAGNGDHGPYTVIAMDLPNCGYADKFDNRVLSPLPQPSNWAFPDFPMLEFVQGFVIAFVAALGAAVGRDLRPQMASVIGGSLGGNTVLRIAESGLPLSPAGAPFELPWAQNLVAWSPASVWAPLTDLVTQAGPKTCLSNAAEPETPDSRREYFSDVFDAQTVPFLIPPQPQTWYRPPGPPGHYPDPSDPYWPGCGNECWSWDPCKQAEIAAARTDRQEVYHEFFRTFHWRVAYEQLLFSHIKPDGNPVCASAQSRLLIASGACDMVPTNDIYTATQTMATLMPTVPGTTLYLNDTGHSIHNERPAVLASAIREFLPQPLPLPDTQESWDAWTSLGGTQLGGFDVGVDALGRMQVLAIAASGRPTRCAQPAARAAFSSWATFDDSLASDVVLTGSPAYGVNGKPHRLEVFARSSADTFHDWEKTDQPPGDWHGWDGGLIGNPASDPSVTTKPNGLLVMGVLDQDGKVRIRGQNSLGGWWMNSQTIGNTSFARGPWLATCDSSGLLLALAIGTDGSLYAATTTEVNGDTWNDWGSMGVTPVGGPALANDHIGNLWVVVCQADGTLNTTKVSASGVSNVWSNLGGSLASNATPTAVRNVWNGLQIFARWNDGSVRYLRQDPSTWGWSSWFSLGGTVGSDPIAVTFSNGSAVFASDGAGGVTFRQQT